MMFFISKVQVKWMGSCPFHHRHPDTYTTLSHVLIWSQWAYFYRCHVWHQWCEVPLIHIGGLWFSSNMGASCLGYHKLANMWRFDGVVECLASKASITYARLETIMFHCGWCFTRTPNIVINCKLMFYFFVTLPYVLVLHYHGESITYYCSW